MVTDCQNESLTDLITKVEVLSLAVESEGGIDVSHDVGVVPEEVVLESLSEEGGVAEDAEELAELGEVLGDVSAVLNCGGEVHKDELFDLVDTVHDVPESGQHKVFNHGLNIGDKSLCAVDTADEVVDMVLLDDAVHHSSQEVDGIVNGHVADLSGSLGGGLDLEIEFGRTCHSQGGQDSQKKLFEHLRCLYLLNYYN